VPVGGTVGDASGIASLTINGVPLPLTATGGFSTALPLVLGPNTITVRATDGAGNASEVTRTVTRTGIPPAASRPRLTALKAGFSRGRLVVRVTLTANARVSVQLLRRTVKTTPRRRVVLSGATKPVIRSLVAGTRLVKLTPPKKLRAGSYVVRVRVVSALDGASVRTSGILKVKPVLKRR
jgi:methionine-rich copper-binding protein CopC